MAGSSWEVSLMGAWGTAIFSDDFACDVRDDYIVQLAGGKTNEEATQIVMGMHYNEVRGTEDESVFWFALALTQWKKGRLINEIKEKALEFIDNGSDLDRWNTPGNEKNYKKRIKVLEGLKCTIKSQMPEAKKIRKPSWVWTSPWREGALLCYKTMNDKDLKEYADKYILVRIVNVFKNESGGFISESVRLGLYGWIGDEVPNSDITNKFEFIGLSDTTDPVLGRMLIRSYCTTISKKEIKERNIVCIGRDESYSTSIPEFFSTPQVCNAYTVLDVLDSEFTEALDRYFKGKSG